MHVTEIKAIPAVASIFVRQFLCNLVSIVSLRWVGDQKAKGCRICSFGGHKTLENMVCRSCGDPVFFFVVEVISDFSVASANVFRLLLLAQRNLEDGEGDRI